MATSGIGRTIRQIRNERRLSLEVVAGRAGITAGYLSLIERGQRSLDSRSKINAIASALEVAPTELAEEMIAPEGKMPQDARLPEVRRALMAVNMKRPDGQVQSSDILNARVLEMVSAMHSCDHEFMGRELPSLIRDLHTTLNSNRDERHVLRLIVALHLQGTQAWLPVAGASSDLSWQAAMLGQSAAERLEEPVWLSLAAFGTAHGLLASGAFHEAGQELANTNAGTATNDALVATGMINLATSLLAAAKGDDGARLAPLDEAAEIARRVDRPDPLFGFSPASVGLWRMSVLLEAGDHAGTAKVAEAMRPEELPSDFRRAHYWVNYGRALAKLPRQRTMAVQALRKAELISPARVHRNPLARETLGQLVARAKRDAVGRELRGLAHRSGLRV